MKEEETNLAKTGRPKKTKEKKTGGAGSQRGGARVKCCKKAHLVGHWRGVGKGRLFKCPGNRGEN